MVPKAEKECEGCPPAREGHEESERLVGGWQIVLEREEAMTTKEPVAPSPSVVYVEKRGNGLAVASLVLGVVGALFGLIPLTFFIAFACGAVGLCLGIPAVRASKRNGRRVMAWFGTGLSVLALVLGVVGVVIVNSAAEELDRDLDQIGRDFSTPSR